MFKHKTYNLFIFFNSGAIGDFLMMVDMAIRAHEATNAESVIILKGNVRFLRSFLEPYPFIQALPYTPKTALSLLFKSFTRRACILWETANIGYQSRVILTLKFFHYVTPTRVVALQVQDEFSFLGKDAIPFLNDRRIYKIGIQMLNHVGLQVNTSPPHIEFIADNDIFSDYSFLKGEYIVVCPTTSGFSGIKRTWPNKRWARLISSLYKFSPKQGIVFIGGPEDQKIFTDIVSALEDVPSQKIFMFCGTLTAQQMMTLFSYARLFIGVRTGTTAVASCINMKGEIIQLDSRPTETIWHYDYNPRIHFFINLEECKCRPMNFVPCHIRDKDDRLLYHRCNYFIDDNEVITLAHVLLSNK
jgi:ADP-heptose:LPS heptosyltransferase